MGRTPKDETPKLPTRIELAEYMSLKFSAEYIKRGFQELQQDASANDNSANLRRDSNLFDDVYDVRLIVSEDYEPQVDDYFDLPGVPRGDGTMDTTVEDDAPSSRYRHGMMFVLIGSTCAFVVAVLYLCTTKQDEDAAVIITTTTTTSNGGGSAIAKSEESMGLAPNKPYLLD
eukprot:CAMPEP_0118689060 /NCGR_PEP_ID=MMETSP0800-20121206/9268_1 /TAXON_ID=210618 ORGANISM="Striatella unipunctata, Strain CCMP2910" /NCGR_SAMPLE_ID=MMETSP0800 /ASSEMBLY_ACC=CAM_ASM_000638 /LENGTH=172 /DNA_ID=CAMNT_0006586393 /DNA_START=173 /DNA_END=691 /DNA_ORIENTATION=-